MPEVKEKWMEDAAEQICAESFQSHFPHFNEPYYAELIARHFAARERATEQLFQRIADNIHEPDKWIGELAKVTKVPTALERKAQLANDAARERDDWHPKTEHPARAGWYDVYRYDDGHRSVRCWDDSIEAWMYVGDHHSLFVPNNSFDVWRPLPAAPFTAPAASRGEEQL